MWAKIVGVFIIGLCFGWKGEVWMMRVVCGSKYCKTRGYFGWNIFL